MNGVTLKEIIKMIELLFEEEKRQLTEWLLATKEDHELSSFSYLTSQRVLEKEWLNEEEDKAWENL